MNIPSKTGREERILEGILSKSSRKFKGKKGEKREISAAGKASTAAAGSLRSLR